MKHITKLKLINHNNTITYIYIYIYRYTQNIYSTSQNMMVRVTSERTLAGTQQTIY